MYWWKNKNNIFYLDGFGPKFNLTSNLHPQNWIHLLFVSFLTSKSIIFKPWCDRSLGWASTKQRGVKCIFRKALMHCIKMRWKNALVKIWLKYHQALTFLPKYIVQVKKMFYAYWCNKHILKCTLAFFYQRCKYYESWSDCSVDLGWFAI